MTKLYNIFMCLFVSTLLSIPDASMLTEFLVKLHIDTYSGHPAHNHENIADETSPHQHSHRHSEDGDEHSHDHFSHKTPEMRGILIVSMQVDSIAVFNILSSFSIHLLLSNPHPQRHLRPPMP